MTGIPDCSNARSVCILSALALLATLAVVAPQPAQAQPFNAWMTSSPGYPTSSGYLRVAPNAALNPTGAFTFEAWVSMTNSSSGEDCRTIAGKNYLQAWWIGLCTVSGKPTLRSYLKGGGSLRNGGEIEPGRWTHIAVVFNGSKRIHYINGELAAQFDETGPLSVSGSEMRIGSDVSWEHSPTGATDEVRLWNVARTQAQIRDAMSRALNAAQPGLVGVWALDANANDVVGPFDGSLVGSGVGFTTFPAVFSCGAGSVTSLCLQDRFLITSRWRTNPAPGTLTDGESRVVGCANEGSGLFWFFSSDNWEVMVKALNGCGLNNRFWIFSSASTNVFYRMDVLDVRAGVQKIYFNYPGPPAPAVTDVNAFATCP